MKLIAKIAVPMSMFTLLLAYTNCSQKNFETLSLPVGSATLNSSTAVDPTVRQVFMISGKLGRTMMSCDDGLTWINNRSDDDTGICWGSDPNNPHNVECDHDPRSSVGLTAGDGWFFTVYGWGYNGTVRRSRDGKNWQTVHTDNWGGGAAYAKGKLTLAWGEGEVSADQGLTWTPMANSNFEALNHAFLGTVGDKMFAYGRSGVSLSTDQGQNWRVLPADSGATRPMIEGNGRIVSFYVVAGANGADDVAYTSISTDNGTTWTQHQIWSGPSGQNIYGAAFDGVNYVHWTYGKVWKSTDAINWTSTPTVGGPPVERVLAFNPVTKTYAAATANWGGWYGNQKFYRSKDGITWTELAPSAYTASHPLAYMIVSEMENKYCP